VIDYLIPLKFYDVRAAHVHLNSETLCGYSGHDRGLIYPPFRIAPRSEICSAGRTNDERLIAC
jgi:hypothetical protein